MKHLLKLKVTCSTLLLIMDSMCKTVLKVRVYKYLLIKDTYSYIFVIQSNCVFSVRQCEADFVGIVCAIMQMN